MSQTSESVYTCRRYMSCHGYHCKYNVYEQLPYTLKLQIIHYNMQLLVLVLDVQQLPCTEMHMIINSLLSNHISTILHR